MNNLKKLWFTEESRFFVFYWWNFYSSVWRKTKILFSQPQNQEYVILEADFKKMTLKTYQIINFIQMMCDKFYLIDIFFWLNILLFYIVCQVINIEILMNVIKTVDGRLFFKAFYCFLKMNCASEIRWCVWKGKTTYIFKI